MHFCSETMIDGVWHPRGPRGAQSWASWKTSRGSPLQREADPNGNSGYAIAAKGGEVWGAYLRNRRFGFVGVAQDSPERH
eukprot:9969594-Alexandrium_andersonii.AAC.1